MRIFAKVKTKSKEQKVIKVESPSVLFNTKDKFDEYLEISVKELPLKNKANKAVIKILSDHYQIPIHKVKIISGQTSKFKIIKIDTK